MLVLALDTGDARGSIALLRDSVVLCTEAHASTDGYSSWLLPAITRVLTAAQVAMPDIDLYAVATGPGSFTGVRVGLTTVKAWSEIFGRPIAAVSRLQAVAAESIGSSPYVAAFIDARRDQIFAALYRRETGVLQRVDDEAVIAPDKFLEWCAAQVGSDRIDWVSTDPQCLTQTQQWPSRLARHEAVQLAPPLLAPRIGQIGYALAKSNNLLDALALDANYVRRADAELFWKGYGHRG
jgi:tRNA threonylcarbamoyladenosine biosynthesis protein TsaB